MILYVLAQEPLYQAIKKTKQIKAIELPCKETKLLGFADDTTIFVKTEASIIFLFHILDYFNEASSIKINVRKTRIFGFGEWRGRDNWPYPHIKVEMTSINILGITYAHDINAAIDLSWSEVLHKIKQKIHVLSSRSLTLFQRAVIINATILSKVWYIAHTYPLSCKYSKLINKEIFPYLWLSKYNPIKRESVHQCKYNGGLGVINVFYKAQSILASTFLNQFLNSDENDSILKYYCSIRLNPIFNIRELPSNISYSCPKYLDDLVKLTRKLIHIPKFPNVNSSDIYSMFLPKPLTTGNHVINTTCKKSWKHMNFVYIDIWGRELMFKFLHNIITTKMRLFQIKRADSPLCETCHVCEDKQHMFSDCVKVILIRDYFKDLLRNICGIENRCMNKILHLDIKSKSKQDTNTAVILTTAYISTVWLNRSSTTQIQMSH